ncbi:ankyrin repeat-containing domain protein [Ilyonectria sp. MPI-CAGE-AT-0026]|nr:ankyrin repeat-containing domain protein [Ilyonectria sp. MPI-CAGE-AT-0026]
MEVADAVDVEMLLKSAMQQHLEAAKLVDTWDLDTLVSSLPVPETFLFFSKFPNEIKYMVFEQMPRVDLLNTRYTCKMLSELALDVLVTRDSTRRAPQFLWWAALFATDQEGVKMIKRFNRRKVKATGVNTTYWTKGRYCTALHLAAARNALPIVEALLEIGADVHGYSHNLESILMEALGPRFEISGHLRSMIQDKASLDCILQSSWQPLFVPAVLGSYGVQKILLDKGASGCLTSPVNKSNLRVSGCSLLRPKPGAMVLTLLHLPRRLVAMSVFSLEVSHRLHLANFQCPGSGFTPLHLAVLNGDHGRIVFMVEQGCAVNAVDRSGRSPLFRAAEMAAAHPRWEFRKSAFEALEALVTCNANLNQHHAGVQGETVLIRLAFLVRHHWRRRHTDIKRVIEYLIRSGASVNDRDNFGSTMLTVLCKAIKASKGNRSIEAYFFRLVNVFGANPNLHSMPPVWNVTQSLVGMSIDLDSIRRFTTALDQAGMRLLSHEVDYVFDLYVDRAFSTLLTTDTRDGEERFTTLRNRFSATGGFEFVLWSLIPSPAWTVTRLIKAIVAEDVFNPDYVNSQKGFLHLLVEKVEDPTFDERTAVKNIDFFLKAGSSLLLKDGNGRTPLDLLRTSSTKRPKLERFLEREMARIQG